MSLMNNEVRKKKLNRKAAVWKKLKAKRTAKQLRDVSATSVYSRPILGYRIVLHQIGRIQIIEQLHVLSN